MKKVVVLFAGLTLLAANSAMASKARLNALGQDEGGSYYINDTRNMFLNPASLNQFGNFVTIEVGDADDAVDADGNNAEGGFAMEMGGMTYGLYLGHQASPGTTDALDGDFATPTNTLEVFVAGEAGVNWGASFYYSAVENSFDGTNTAEESMSQMGLRAGVSTDMWSANLGLGLGTTAERADDEFEGAMSYRVGGTYNVGTGLVYADIRGGGYNTTIATIDSSITQSSYELGWANTQEIQEGAFFFYSVAYNMTSQEDTEVDDSGQSSSSLPITLGFEANANSWLALRGSVKQNVFLGSSTIDAADPDTFTTPSTTQVGAGASLMFEQLRVDGTVFTGGTLDTASLLGQVALTYNF